MPADINSFLGLNLTTHCGGRRSTRWFSTGENGFPGRLKARILATYPGGEARMGLVVSHKFQAGPCQGCPPESDDRRAPIDRRRLIARLGIGAAGIGAGTTLPGRIALAAGTA